LLVVVILDFITTRNLYCSSKRIFECSVGRQLMFSQNRHQYYVVYRLTHRFAIKLVAITSRHVYMRIMFNDLVGGRDFSGRRCEYVIRLRLTTVSTKKGELRTNIDFKVPRHLGR
jgi:hypothetical protein